MFLLIGLAVGTQPAAAGTAGDFYKGRTITILVGFQAGGGYDFLARFMARFLGQHIPGNPNIIVQDMPTAGGVAAERYLLDAAPRDGTVLGVPTESVAFDTVLGYSADIDAGKFQWLGRLATNVELGVASAKSGTGSIADLRAHAISIGGTGGTADSTVIPFLLNKLGGTKFKLISGYRSAHESMLAMQRGEIDAVGGIGLGTLELGFANQLKDGSLRILYQSGLGRHSDIPDVPNIAEFGRSEEEKGILRLFTSSSAIGRSLVAPPGVPADHVAALRQAMTGMLADPTMRAFASAHNIKIDPASATEIEAIVRDVLKTPKPLADASRAVLDSMKTSR